METWWQRPIPTTTFTSNPTTTLRRVCSSLDFTASGEEITRLLKSFSYETIWPPWWMLVLHGISRGYSYGSNTKQKKQNWVNEHLGLLVLRMGANRLFDCNLKKRFHASCRLSLVCPKLVVQRNPLVHHLSDTTILGCIHVYTALKSWNNPIFNLYRHTLNRMNLNTTKLLSTWSWG